MHAKAPDGAFFISVILPAKMSDLYLPLLVSLLMRTRKPHHFE